MRPFLSFLFATLICWTAYALYQSSANPTPPLITTTNSGKIIAPALPSAAKNEPISSVTAESTPTAPSTTASTTSELPTETAKVSNNTDTPSVLDSPPTVNPLAPCPKKINACFGALANNILDLACPPYKPVWAYITKDEGVSWIRVGCFATEIDAEKALEKSRKLSIAQLEIKMQNNNLESIAPSETKQKEEAKQEHAKDLSSMTKISNEPVKTDTRNSELENKTEIKPETTKIEPLPVVNQEEPQPQAPAPREQVHPIKTYIAEFKTLLNIATIDTRTYPTEEMRKKALELWDRDQRILEPDGSINEKYMIKKPKTLTLPTHY